MSAACAVIGLGFVGTSTLRLLARAGCRVRGYDVAPAAAARAAAALGAELEGEGDWAVGTDPAVLAEAETVLVAVRLTRDREGAFSDAALRAVADALARHGGEGQLVILESTLQPGTTRRFAAWLNRPDMAVAHAPERLRIGDDDAALRATPRLVGGLTPAATARAQLFLQAVGLTPVPVSAPEVSELAKLLENAFLSVNIGLIGEFTRLAHAAGVAAREVTEAAATKPHGYLAFHPGPGIGGHCLRNDLDLVRRHAAGLALATPLLDGVARTVPELPALVLRRLSHRLAAAGRPLAGARVLLVGVGFKIGSCDLTETPAAPIVRGLRAAGAEPCYADAQIPAFAVDDQPVPRLAPAALAGAGLSAALILAGDRTLAIASLRAACPCLLDAGGGAIMAGACHHDEQI